MSVPRDAASPMAPRVHQRTWGLAGLIASLSMLGPFSIDLYLPAFPAIAREFSASPIAMQQTLSAYLFAYGFMMLWHGALSDALGRRPIVIGGLAIYGFATLGCAIAGNIETLWLFRAAQGICAGTGLVIGRAIIRDRFQGTEAQRLMSQITLIFSVAPAVAPIIGGVLLNTLGWRSIFWVLLLWVLGMLFWSAKFLPETLHPSHRHALRPRVLWRNYAKVIANPEFTMLSLIPTLNFAAFFIYIAAAPAFLVDLLGVSTWGFAWLFLPMIAGVIAGAVLSGRMAGRYSPQRTIRTGYSLIAAGAVAQRPDLPVRAAFRGVERRADHDLCGGQQPDRPERNDLSARSLPDHARDGLVAAGVRPILVLGRRGGNHRSAPRALAHGPRVGHGGVLRRKLCVVAHLPTPCAHNLERLATVRPRLMRVLGLTHVLGVTFLAASLHAAAAELPTTTLTIGAHKLTAEIAVTPAQRETGLMNRFSLKPDTGMLFVFERAEPLSFWMRNTYFALSIAFIGTDGRILNIEDMQPQTDNPHWSKGAALYALEMKKGWFAERGIGVGEAVKGLPTVGAKR